MFNVESIPSRTVMGLMSGTSVDGVDACLARLGWKNGRLQYEILATYTQDMPDSLRQRLLTCMADKTVGLEELCALNVAVGELFADTAVGLMRAHAIPASQIDCIGSHGQTLYHWPPVRESVSTSVQKDSVGVKGLEDIPKTPRSLGGTLQIGEPTLIAEKTGVYTIADFRPGDMAAGGQGAPLVCMADLLLFQNAQHGRCIQNIGGIANVTVLPSRDAQQAANKPIIAFDTGPGNMLMDAAMAHFYKRPYDENGAVAASGTIDETLLTHLMTHPYLQQTPPKTTGREQFGEPCFQELLVRFPTVSPENWLATLTRYTADSIVEAYERFVFPAYDVAEMIVGGGGAYNAVLMQTLAARFRECGRDISVKTHADFGIHDKYKEALAFAILAWLALERLPNNLPECTGARRPVILGKHIFP